MNMKRLSLEIDIDPELMNIEYISDKERLSQVLVNLLSNSLKFTYKGFIRIRIQKCVEDSHSRQRSNTNSPQKGFNLNNIMLNNDN